MASDAPRLSVLIITYNQERYIEQTVRSALMQQTHFPYEIVIGEDCSTDGTRDVLRRLDAENPGRLRLLFRERNLGIVRNFMETYAACRGEYVATIGGDDYWTDPHKLGKQVAVLDADANCSICYHRVRIVDGAGRSSGAVFPFDAPRITGKDDIARTCHIPALSAVLRKSALPELPAWMTRLPFEDWPLYVLFAEAGHFVQHEEVMADYRCHAGGWWTGKSNPDRVYNTVKMFVVLDQELGGRTSFDFAQCGREVVSRVMDESEVIKASLSWRLLRSVLSPLDRLGLAHIARALALRRSGRTSQREAELRLRPLREVSSGIR